MLRIAGWLFVPFIMVLVQWKILNKNARIIGGIWAGILLITVAFSNTEDPKNVILSSHEPAKIENSTIATLDDKNEPSSNKQNPIPIESAPVTNTIAEPIPSVEKQDNEIQEPVIVADDGLIAAKVISITDGDTIKVSIDGKVETIRLLLIDTPETKDPNEPVQPFGPEATVFAEEILAGQDVQLEYDGPLRDKYDRLLAYLWIGDKIFNQMLIEEGLARIAYIYDPPYTHYDAFVKAEAVAKATGFGIWSIEGYTTDNGFIEEVAIAQEEPEADPEPIHETVYYKNCTSARDAGAAPVRKGDPGYAKHLDRDGDGIGCE